MYLVVCGHIFNGISLGVLHFQSKPFEAIGFGGGGVLKGRLEIVQGVMLTENRYYKQWKLVDLVSIGTSLYVS